MIREMERLCKDFDKLVEGNLLGAVKASDNKARDIISFSVENWKNQQLLELWQFGQKITLPDNGKPRVKFLECILVNHLVIKGVCTKVNRVQFHYQLI